MGIPYPTDVANYLGKGFHHHVKDGGSWRYVDRLSVKNGGSWRTKSIYQTPGITVFDGENVFTFSVTLSGTRTSTSTGTWLSNNGYVSPSLVNIQQKVTECVV